MNTSITIPLPILTPAEANYRKSMEGVNRLLVWAKDYSKLEEREAKRRISEEAALRVWHNGGVVPMQISF